MPKTQIPNSVEQNVSWLYPKTHTVDVLDHYHGTPVRDPYRWLESLDSNETRDWVTQQNKITFEFLDKIPQRESIRTRLTELWNFEKYSVPFREGNRYFYHKNDGLQNQSILYTTPSLQSQPKVLLDPNQLSKDGTIALNHVSVSPNGKLVAYSLTSAGSDWQEWKIREVDTGQDRADVLKWTKFTSVAWTKDSQGLYYGRYKEPTSKEFESVNYFHKLYFHCIGTPQSQDDLVYEQIEDSKKEWNYSPTVTDDGRYLIVTVAKGTDDKYRILYRDLNDSNHALVELIGNFDAEYSFIDNDGPIFWFKTNLNAPRGRVIAIDIRNPQPQNWREIIPQSSNNLVHISRINQRFFVTYLNDAYSQVKVFDSNGKFIKDIQLPGIGTVTGLTGKNTDQETFYAFTSFNTPDTVYRLDANTLESSLFKKPALKFNPDDYETKQIFYTSKDGTRIPMFLSHKKGLQLSRETPTYLYGYGGFNIPITPSFSVHNLVFMEMGGLIAIPNLRGGGEYGEEWHKAGTKLNKQNVFNDFIAAAEWLIAQGYTQPQKLSIAGRSNGGLLVGATMTQRPDLFAAALPGVGVLDMLRFHKFTIGWAWIDDYGSSDKPEEFKALYAYSPYHNVKQGAQYPATMITTGDHDDRVVPGHSFKFAAALQAAQSGPAPIFIRIDVRAGHGAGKPTSKRIAEVADQLAFLAKILRMQ